VFLYGLAVLAALWVALLVAAPFLPAAVSALTYAVASFICHQLPERSFHVGSFQLPVCARCLGLYAGGALGSAAGIVGALALLSRPTAWVIALAGAVPTAATVTLESAGLWYPSNDTRAIAGILLGAAVAFVVANALRTGRAVSDALRSTVHYAECAPRRPTAPNPPPPSI
jgi:uncharacterized membrane protein